MAPKLPDPKHVAFAIHGDTVSVEYDPTQNAEYHANIALKEIGTQTETSSWQLFTYDEDDGSGETRLSMSEPLPRPEGVRLTWYFTLKWA